MSRFRRGQGRAVEALICLQGAGDSERVTGQPHVLSRVHTPPPRLCETLDASLRAGGRPGGERAAHSLSLTMLEHCFSPLKSSGSPKLFKLLPLLIVLGTDLLDLHPSS